MANTLKDKDIDTKKKCKSCRQMIDSSAKICYHCQRHQNFWAGYFRDPAIIVSIVMMVMAGVQLTLAFRERIEASKAVGIAKKAAIDANLALTQVQSDANEINILKKEFELISELQLAIMAAQSGDRKAYDKLKNWGRNESYEYSDMAFDVYKTIEGRYVGALSVPYVMYPDPNNEHANLSFSDLSEGYSETNRWFHAYFVNRIWGRKDFSEKKRLEFLIDVLQNGEDLTAVYFAGKYITKEAKLDWNPFNIQPLMDWWEENREKYNENPEDQPTKTTDEKQQEN